MQYACLDGEDGVAIRGLLRVAFGRCVIAADLRVSKEELGMDHFEIRGWRCIHQHYYVTDLSFLLCSRIRKGFTECTAHALPSLEIRFQH